MIFLLGCVMDFYYVWGIQNRYFIIKESDTNDMKHQTRHLVHHSLV